MHFLFACDILKKKSIAKECAQTPDGVCALSFMDEKTTTLETSELFQEGAKFSFGNDDSVEISDLVGKTVLADYGEGRAVNEFKGSPHECKAADGTIVASWERGQLMKVGQVMKDDEGKFWRITGRNFQRDGFPYVIYELLAVD